MKFKSPKPSESVIQLAPMIDIVFLLLIFFLVTWQFSRSEQDSKVKVPTSSQGKEETRAISEINVNIRQGGRACYQWRNPYREPAPCQTARYR